MEQQPILTLGKSDYLSRYLSPNGYPYDKLVVGAIIFHPCHTGSDDPQILLLKRSAHEKDYPNVFEIPGGHVEDTDSTILDALKREVYEEAALTVLDVIGAVEPFSYSSEKIVQSGDGQTATETIIKVSLQQSFVCQVGNDVFHTNPEEHSEGTWATKVRAAAL